MEIHNESIHQQAMTVLRSLYGEGAKFRSGQYEAIEATMLHRRTLVVQRTGWGKSLVYFTCTKLLRNQGRGLTIVVSPLLTLMENQIEAAGHLGLRCDALNSTTADRRPEILDRMAAGTLDLVLVTPETLFREDIRLGPRFPPGLQPAAGRDPAPAPERPHPGHHRHRQQPGGE